MRHPILSIYVRWFTWAPRLLRWALVHPRLASAICISGLLVLGFIFDTVIARAADDTTIDSAPPYLATLMGTDDEGVPLAAYAMLPLDYSDSLHPLRALPGVLVSMIWAIHMFAIAWILTFMDWLISFEWVSWLGTPIEALAGVLQSKLSGIGWVPMALALAALVAGVVIFRGRFGAGVIDLGVSIMSAILVAGALANPITSITAENGGLDTVQAWGKELMTDFFVDEDEQQANSDEDNVIANEITQPLASLFIRQPAQSIAFGHTLIGECDEVFTDQMKTSSPIAGGEDTVRDKVADCDPVAKIYVFSPNYGQVFTAAISLFGVCGVLMIAVILAVLLVGSILMTFWDGLKAMGSAYIAVLPAVGRYTLWKSIMGVLFGLGSIVLFLVLIGGFLKLVVEVMRLVGAAGIPNTMQLGFISFTFFVMLGLLLWTWYKVRKSSEGTAAWLSKFGLGTGSGPGSSGGLGKAAVAVAGFRAVTGYLGKTGRSRPNSADPGDERGEKPGIEPAKRQAQPALGSGDNSHVRSGDDAPATTGAETADTASSALRIAKGGTRGPGGAAAAIALEAGKRLARKRQEKRPHLDAALRAAQAQQAVSAARWERRISVDSNGVGHIRKAEREPIVYTATPSRGHDRSVRNRELRQTLVRGAIERGTGARV